MEVIAVEVEEDGQTFEVEVYLNGVCYYNRIHIAQDALDGEYDSIVEFAFEEAEEMLLSKQFDTGKD